MKPCRIHLVAAARPNFMKVAPLYHALAADADFTPVLIHTGQHYDPNMSDAIFADLGLPQPDHHLGIGSGSHAEQTGRVMIAYEALAVADRPDWLIVVGDVNSTLACTLAATKIGIKVIHLEAGLRSRDRTMPEELNRLATDALADVLWTPSPDADSNLLIEGIPPSRVTRVGNIMLDSFEIVRASIASVQASAAHDFRTGSYGIVTLHRPSNVDGDALIPIVDALLGAHAQLPLVFPVHPRTARRLTETGLDRRLGSAGVRLIGPQSYVSFMTLVCGASAVVTDSGGVQEETTYLGIPCLTLRANTERPITVTEGTNRLVRPGDLVATLVAALAEPRSARRRPELWDGRTATRCLADLRRRSRLEGMLTAEAA